jgi:hypothetical protein
MYASFMTSDGVLRGISYVLGLGLVGLMIAAQLFLASRFRRRLNQSLLAATLISTGLFWYVEHSVASAEKELKLAKDDAFESIHSLLKARAIAYDANGDESRYLLDKERAQFYDDAFIKNVNLLTGGNKLDNSLKTGLIGQELSNITFEGELQAAQSVVFTLKAYMRIDKSIRDLEKKGKHADAIELCIGSRPDESNAAFDAFDRALEDTIKINQDQFDKAVVKSDRALDFAKWAAPLTTILVALLAFFGMRARLREYAA